MDESIEDILHSEEQLRNTLHCDDKEKLRRKLAQLQREYLKTAQRLKRAERLDAVRRHVKSRISLQNHQHQGDPKVTSISCKNPSSNNTGIPSSPQGQGAIDPDTSRRQQVIRFSLPGESACPQTPDPSSDVARGHRPSPALRLRSRRSRLRWERRSVDTLRSSDSGKQQELTGGSENTRIADEQEGFKGENVVNESQELFSGPESESPSLLLAHWSTQESTESGDKMGKENQRPLEQREKETVLEVDRKCALITEEEKLNAKENSSIHTKIGDDGVEQREERETMACEVRTHEDTEQTAAQNTGNENSVHIKEEKDQITADAKPGSLLESCTLVEGLLFPVEYYVRTTRRMTLSQSQPDVQAVLLSQLSAGRHRRSRRRGTNRDVQRSHRHTQTDMSSSTIPSASLEPPLPSPANDCSHSSSDISCSAIPESPFTPSAPSLHPPRGRGRGRGKGRHRRAQPPKQGCEQTEGGVQPPGIPVSFTHPVEGTNTCMKPLQVDQEPVAPQQAQPSSSLSRGPTSFPAENREKLYPLFLKSSTRQMNTAATSDWQSLLLPSVSSSSETPQLPLPALISRLRSLEIQQDFHLPDEQFASLKLHKLRQVAVESGLEHFLSPSHNTRRRSTCLYSAISPPMRCSLPLSLTPTITSSPCLKESERTSEHLLADRLTSVNEKPHDPNLPETNVDAGSVLQEFTECCEPEEHKTVSQESPVLSCRDKSINFVEPQVHQSTVSRAVCKETDVEHSDEPAEKQIPLEDSITTDPRFEDSFVAEELCFDNSESKTAEDALISCTDSVCTDAVAKPSLNNLNLQNPSGDFEAPTKTDFSEERMITDQASQFLFKSPLDTLRSQLPYLPSSAPASSPVLPSLGITPNTARLTSSPSAPPLLLPPTHSPSTQDLSPPDLSPCPSFASLPPNLPPPSLCSQMQELSEPQAPSGPGDRDEPAASQTPSEIQLQSSAGKVGATTEDHAEKLLLRCTHTLEAPAGGFLVDACCVAGPSSSLFVAAAGKWAVCLWSQTSESNWSLKHTWTFSEPVINVFPVPDSAGLMFVSLGQLEIRELRMLSCCSLRQTLICEGIIQAAVGLYDSRVVTSADSSAGSTLQVFTLSDSSSLQNSQPLVSPGVCVSALAPVEGLSDALTGTDEGGHIFIWNLKTGQLLSRVLLEHGFSNTACLRGYSYGGVLLVLLQHLFLSSLDQEEKEPREQNLSLSAVKTPALFSLVAINPLSGKSVLATQLRPPKGWTGRLCEVDVSRSNVVGLSQSGCICVWELLEGGMSRTAEVPEDEDWQLARWGQGDTLVIGHQNGDVSLHCYCVKANSD